MERPSVAPNPGRSGVLLGNNSSTTQSDVAPEKILFEHYKRFISETYPDKRKTELVCPFLRLHPEEYEHITTSGCQKNGFDDVSRLKTHIDRTHVQGQVADENKRGPRVPMIDTVQGLHNWRAYKKDRTGVNSKKNPKDTATKWWDLARNSADPHAQPCGHRDDFHLDFPGSDFQKFVKFMQWLKESGNGYLHLNEPQPQRPTTGNLPMATQDHRTFLNDRPESNIPYEPRPHDDSGYGSIGGQIEEEESRHGFQDCDIPKEYVNPADLMGAGSFASLDTGHDGDAMMSYIDFSSDPASS